MFVSGGTTIWPSAKPWPESDLLRSSADFFIMETADQSPRRSRGLFGCALSETLFPDVLMQFWQFHQGRRAIPFIRLEPQGSTCERSGLRHGAFPQKR